MPTLSRLVIKTSLASLRAALLVGVVMGAWPLFGLDAIVGALWPVYLHLFVVGWLTQLIFGVAFWLFPRHSRQQPHGTTGLVWASYGALNAGLLLRTVAEPGVLWSHHAAWTWSLAAGALLQWSAALFFAIAIWSRIKAK